MSQFQLLLFITHPYLYKLILDHEHVMPFYVISNHGKIRQNPAAKSELGYITKIRELVKKK